MGVLPLFILEELVAEQMREYEVEQPGDGQVAEHHEDDRDHVEGAELFLADKDSARVGVGKELHEDGPADVEEVHGDDYGFEALAAESHDLYAHALLGECVCLHYRQETACDGF